MDIKSFVGKNVNIECTDGEKFNDYYVDCFTERFTMMKSKILRLLHKMQ